MNKKFLVAVVIGLITGGIITATTYAVSHNNPKITCIPGSLQKYVPQSIQWQIAYDEAHPPIPTRERGFPFIYYRESSVSRKSSVYGGSSMDKCSLDAGVKTGLLSSNLIFDYLIWSAVAVVVSSGALLIIRGKHD
jgi:hypothetical protein